MFVSTEGGSPWCSWTHLTLNIQNKCRLSFLIRKETQRALCEYSVSTCHLMICSFISTSWHLLVFSPLCSCCTSTCQLFGRVRGIELQQWEVVLSCTERFVTVTRIWKHKLIRFVFPGLRYTGEKEITPSSKASPRRKNRFYKGCSSLSSFYTWMRRACSTPHRVFWRSQQQNSSCWDPTIQINLWCRWYHSKSRLLLHPDTGWRSGRLPVLQTLLTQLNVNSSQGLSIPNTSTPPPPHLALSLISCCISIAYSSSGCHGSSLNHSSFCRTRTYH